MTGLQTDVLAVIINHGKENPITGKQIAFAVELQERDLGKKGADLRSIVNALRVKGYPICASGGGYYYAKTEKELDEFIESFAGRIEKQASALMGLRKAKESFIVKDVPVEEEKSEKIQTNLI